MVHDDVRGENLYESFHINHVAPSKELVKTIFNPCRVIFNPSNWHFSNFHNLLENFMRSSYGFSVNSSMEEPTEKVSSFPP